jgi:glycosyltransferase involved in cell wall biosynthesis
MKTALVHDWLDRHYGSEKVLEALYELFPSPLYTLLDCKTTKFPFDEIHESFLRKIPFVRKYFRKLAPLFPLAVESLDLSAYDLILSSSHAVAKGVLTHADQLHICYCHTPMRYAWDLHFTYLQECRQKTLTRIGLHYLRGWDIASSQRVDHYIANSQCVARRINKYYRREATVIYPPVDTGYFALQEKKEEYYVTIGRFVPYKMLDTIVSSFAKTPHRKLVVIASGKMKECPPNVERHHFLPQERVRQLLQGAKGFVYMAKEDFGIAPVEAMSCGTPVIAYGQGGVFESVGDRGGILFPEQTEVSLLEALDTFEKCTFNPVQIRQRALPFSRERFLCEMETYIREKYESRNSGRREREPSLAHLST